MPRCRTFFLVIEAVARRSKYSVTSIEQLHQHDHHSRNNTRVKSKQVWKFIAGSLRSGNAAALIVVVESTGASPGKAGFKMAVAADGTRVGTIGGGVMEMNLVERAANALRSNETQPVVKRVFHSRETKHEQSGLICSGSQTNLLLIVTPADISTIEKINLTYNTQLSGLLKIVSGTMSFSEQGYLSPENGFSYSDSKTWTYQENIGVLDTIYIVGSGHVGLALSRIMKTLEFHVVAIDDRAEAPTFANNQYADAKHCIHYDAIGKLILEPECAYVTIVTTAYKSDEAALKAILDMPLKYIGLMGSEAKAKQIYDDLLAEGISQSQLESIHSPIGLPIASHTPEEIAISIAAEIINVRNAGKQHD